MICRNKKPSSSLSKNIYNCYNADMKKKELTKEEVMHLAQLANLQLTEKETEDLQKKLSETLDYVENLQELKTENIIPTSQTTQLTDVFFKDGVQDKRILLPEDAVKNAKRKKDGYFEVNKIL